MKQVNLTDLAGGVLVIAVGLYFAIGATEYRMGTVVRMGPGFVPFSLGCIAVILGLAICLAAFRRSGALPEVDWRQALCVLGSIPLFALLLERAGLIPAAFLSVLLSSAALRLDRPLATVALAAAIALMAWGVFVLGLGMPIPAFGNPFA